jgi:multidrug resistance efflux pump
MKLLKNNPAILSEEIKDIIGKIPSSTTNSLIIFITMIVISSIGITSYVKYPDIITGKVTIRTSSSPVKIVSQIDGRLHTINVKKGDIVNVNEIIAVVYNTANINDVFYLKKQLIRYQEDMISDINQINRMFPDSLKLGELESTYFIFKNNLLKLALSKNFSVYKTKITNNNIVYKNRKLNLLEATKLLKLESANLTLANRAHQRDSLLFSQKVISKAEFERSTVQYIASQETFQRLKNDILTQKDMLHEFQTSNIQLNIEKINSEHQINSDLSSSLNEILGQIDLWEHKYVFVSPIKGKVDFLDFLSENMFITAGKELFNIIPDDHLILGEIMAPSNGTGKIRTGQKVNIKLDDYPYMEFGHLQGIVKNTALSTTNDRETNFTMVFVSVPKALNTNLGTTINYKAGISGVAEIITDNRSLLSRIFERVTYTIKQ